MYAIDSCSFSISVRDSTQAADHKQTVQVIHPSPCISGEEVIRLLSPRYSPGLSATLSYICPLSGSVQVICPADTLTSVEVYSSKATHVVSTLSLEFYLPPQ